MILVRRELHFFHLKRTESSLCDIWCASKEYSWEHDYTYMASRRQGYGLASNCN